MARDPARPGHRDGSGPLVAVLAGMCIALIALALKLSIAPGERDYALVYVAAGGLAGYLLNMRH